MKRKITLLTILCFTGYLAQAQLTATTLKEKFTGVWSGNWYYALPPQETATSTGYNTIGSTETSSWSSVPYSGGYMSLGQFNGTATGTSDNIVAFRARGSSGVGSSVFANMTDKLQLTVNTPASTIDTRHSLFYRTNGTEYEDSNTGHLIDISANPTFSLEINNLTSFTGVISIALFKVSSLGYPWTQSNTIKNATILPNQVNYISLTFTDAIGYTNIMGYRIYTNSIVGDIDIDNVRMGFALPTANFDIAAAGGATNVSAGNSLQISASSNAPEYNSEVLWSVVNSNPGATTIDSTGLLTAIPTAANGLVTITGISAYNQALKKVLVLNVGPPKPVTSILVSGSDSLFVSNSFSTPYTATITPSDAADKSITWSIAPTSNNIINILGGVKAQVPGIYTIIGTNTATGVTGSKVIFIGVSVTGLTITGPAAVTIGGVSATFTGAVTPSNTTNKTVIWSTSSATIATINSAGVLNPLLPGTITVTGKLGPFTKTLVVSVISVPGLGPAAINGSELSTSVSVYPNPVSDVLNISFSGVVSSVIVFNTVGTQVAAGAGNNISLASLPAGFYTVEIVTNLGTVFKRVVKN